MPRGCSYHFPQVEDPIHHKDPIDKKFPLKGKPRTLRVTEPSRPVLIFTDGAFEMSETGDPIATIGGVLLRPEQKPKVFGCKVHHALLDRWLESSTHPIGLVELYAVVVAFELWMPEFTRDKVIFFCDNWTTIDVFVRSYSVIEDWRNLLVCLEKLDSQAEAMLWIARVASQSNVADPPSRGSLDTLTFLGDCQLDQPVCPVMHETWCLFSNRELKRKWVTVKMPKQGKQHLKVQARDTS